MKTDELTGAALDWAVAKCGGEYKPTAVPCYSTDWAQGGPIIEREWLDITPWPNESREDIRWHCQQHDSANDCAQYGSTPLEAAMRCYVASKLGNEVDIPDELMKTAGGY
jgi:hypothetical protein